MKIVVRLMAVAAGLLVVQMGVAQAPAGSTGICKDGTYSTAASKKGACGGHQGVKEWYSAPAGAAPAGTSAKPAAGAKAPPGKAATPATAATPAPAAAPAAAPGVATTPAKSTTPPGSSAAKTAAAGGGPGLVWVNSDTKVYHCPGSQFYGKTKSGTYMSEADAKGKGARPDHNKPCGK